MASTDSTATLDPVYRDAITEVEYLIQRRVPFSELEDYIDSLPDLDDEQRSALWLLGLASEDTPDTRFLRRVVVFGPAVPAI